jgi:hypothetical protein
MPCPLWLAGIKSLASIASRARIQLRFPRMVLISPLCATYRYGCASGQDGNVLVENRECTSASADANRGSARSGKNGPSCTADSMPLYTSVREDRLAKYVPASCSARLRRQNAIRSSARPVSPAAPATNS